MSLQQVPPGLTISHIPADIVQKWAVRLQERKQALRRDIETINAEIQSIDDEIAQLGSAIEKTELANGNG